jgi:ketosteroid isomerase-like protein
MVMTPNGPGSAMAVARRLIEAYDPEHPSPEIYAEEIVSWHNYDEREVRLTRDDLSRGAAREHAVLKQILAGFAYEDRRVYAAEDAVVMTHVLVGELPDGTQVRIPACHVCALEGGRIARMDVYMDSGFNNAIGAALEAAGISLAAG